jgi:metallo-beta-lactamase family protein
MKIKFLGASGTVTGSSYVLTSNSGQSLLIDLGMFQGDDKIDKLNYAPYEYDCRELTGAVLTHAHLDHCGRLPILLQKGFKGNIFMTPATRDLAELSLLDSAKIAKQDKRRDERILFDKNQAIATINRFKTTEYNTPLKVGDFSITFRDAGHLLGSSILEIEDTNSTSQYKKIVFSGDLGNSPMLLNPVSQINNADVVIMESTYGDRLHPVEDPADKLQNEINEVEKSGGTLLIPAFSLDRTQELMHLIMHLKKTGKVRLETPIFLDGPMAQKATEIYLSYRNLFNEHIQEDFLSDGPFEFPGLNTIHSPHESKLIWDVIGAKVIIAGSGMMTGGRILNHAINYLSDPLTRLFFVGYQGIGTLGRHLQEGAKQVRIEGKDVNVQATVNSTQSMSSHADQAKLISWLGNMKAVRKVFVTHGEDESRIALKDKINQELGIHDVTLPVQNQEVGF